METFDDWTFVALRLDKEECDRSLQSDETNTLSKSAALLSLLRDVRIANECPMILDGSAIASRYHLFVAAKQQKERCNDCWIPHEDEEVEGRQAKEDEGPNLCNPLISHRDDTKSDMDEQNNAENDTALPPCSEAALQRRKRLAGADGQATQRAVTASKEPFPQPEINKDLISNSNNLLIITEPPYNKRENSEKVALNRKEAEAESPGNPDLNQAAPPPSVHGAGVGVGSSPLFQYAAVPSSLDDENSRAIMGTDGHFNLDYFSYNTNNNDNDSAETRADRMPKYDCETEDAPNVSCLVSCTASEIQLTRAEADSDEPCVLGEEPTSSTKKKPAKKAHRSTSSASVTTASRQRASSPPPSRPTSASATAKAKAQRTSNPLLDAIYNTGRANPKQQLIRELQLKKQIAAAAHTNSNAINIQKAASLSPQILPALPPGVAATVTVSVSTVPRPMPPPKASSLSESVARGGPRSASGSTATKNAEIGVDPTPLDVLAEPLRPTLPRSKKLRAELFLTPVHVYSVPPPPPSPSAMPNATPSRAAAQVSAGSGQFSLSMPPSASPRGFSSSAFRSLQGTAASNTKRGGGVGIGVSPILPPATPLHVGTSFATANKLCGGLPTGHSPAGTTSRSPTIGGAVEVSPLDDHQLFTKSVNGGNTNKSNNDTYDRTVSGLALAPPPPLPMASFQLPSRANVQGDFSTNPLGVNMPSPLESAKEGGASSLFAVLKLPANTCNSEGETDNAIISASVLLSSPSSSTNTARPDPHRSLLSAPSASLAASSSQPALAMALSSTRPLIVTGCEGNSESALRYASLGCGQDYNSNSDAYVSRSPTCSAANPTVNSATASGGRSAASSTLTAATTTLSLVGPRCPFPTPSVTSSRAYAKQAPEASAAHYASGVNAHNDHKSIVDVVADAISEANNAVTETGNYYTMNVNGSVHRVASPSTVRGFTMEELNNELLRVQREREENNRIETFGVEEEEEEEENKLVTECSGVTGIKKEVSVGSSRGNLMCGSAKRFAAARCQFLDALLAVDVPHSVTKAYEGAMKKHAEIDLTPLLKRMTKRIEESGGGAAIRSNSSTTATPTSAANISRDTAEDVAGCTDSSVAADSASSTCTSDDARCMHNNTNKKDKNGSCGCVSLVCTANGSSNGSVCTPQSPIDTEPPHNLGSGTSHAHGASNCVPATVICRLVGATTTTVPLRREVHSEGNSPWSVQQSQPTAVIAKKTARPQRRFRSNTSGAMDLLLPSEPRKDSRQEYREATSDVVVILAFYRLSRLGHADVMQAISEHSSLESTEVIGGKVATITSVYGEKRPRDGDNDHDDSRRAKRNLSVIQLSELSKFRSDALIAKIFELSSAEVLDLEGAVVSRVAVAGL